MATNLVKFPYDLGESDEHHHFLVFRIYSNSSASLSGEKRTQAGDDIYASSPESELLSKLDNSRGAKPNYSNVGDVPDTFSQVGENFDAALDMAVSDTTYRPAEKVNTDAIYLPFPQSINMTDGWEWETVSFQKTALGEAVKGDIAEAAEKGAQDIIGGVGKLGMENADKFMQHAVRRVTNPRKESMFQEPAMRTYSFEFDFAPRNKRESENAQKIIQLFKYHASPELYAGDNALYNYPSEFQIYFVSNGSENQYIGKIDRCALKSCGVNYTNANMWSAFKDTGAPTHLKVSLEFTELTLQSRNSLMKMDGMEDEGEPSEG